MHTTRLQYITSEKKSRLGSSINKNVSLNKAPVCINDEFAMQIFYHLKTIRQSENWFLKFKRIKESKTKTMHEHREFALISQRNKYLQIRNSSISHVLFIEKKGTYTRRLWINILTIERYFGIVAQSKYKKKIIIHRWSPSAYNM